MENSAVQADEFSPSLTNFPPSRYSHVRMEAKRRALDEIAARQRAADERRQEEAEEGSQAVPVPPPPVLVQ